MCTTCILFPPECGDKSAMFVTSTTPAADPSPSRDNSSIVYKVKLYPPIKTEHYQQHQNDAPSGGGGGQSADDVRRERDSRRPYLPATPSSGAAAPIAIERRTRAVLLCFVLLVVLIS